MNDETTPAPGQPNLPPILEHQPAPQVPRPLPKPISYWLKKLLVCNPFYLASAALLLYGVYRISLDENFFSTETRQLIFNFTALQCYEFLLAATATLLVARRIWYDAALLVVLENLLWIVPFILISQAALIDQRVTTVLCVLVFTLAAGRVTWLRTRARDIMPPFRALLCGLPILLVNAAWPVFYRHFQETRMGVTIAGPATFFNDFSWFWLLPALAIPMMFLPAPGPNRPESVMRRWFPLMLFGFWLVGTGVHLYALGYVYDFQLRREQLAPVLWVLAWGLQTRLIDFTPTPPRAAFTAVLFLPLLATTPAAFVADSRVFFYLSALNLAAFVVKVLRQPEHRLALQLGLVSFAAVVAAVPIDFAPVTVQPLTQTNLIGLAALAYVIIGALFSRNPKVAILGSLAATVATGVALQAQADWLHWAVQGGFGYFLLHSLRWQDEEHQGAAGVRLGVALGWVLHTFFWVRAGATLPETLALAGLVLLVYTLRGLLRRRWDPLVLPIAIGLIAICSPTHFVFLKTQAAPVGVLYVVGSFALFGLGTLVALTKHRWHKNHQP